MCLNRTNRFTVVDLHGTNRFFKKASTESVLSTPQSKTDPTQVCSILSLESILMIVNISKVVLSLGEGCQLYLKE